MSPYNYFINAIMQWHTRLYIKKRILVLFVSIAVPALSVAGERLGYTAEHIFEVPMDARYMALPEIETKTGEERRRFDVGYLYASGGLMTSSTLMLGMQDYVPISDDHRWGLIIGGFFDVTQLAGSSGNVEFSPIFTDSAPFPVPQNIYVQNISGDAVHVGVSLSLTQRISNSWAWQTGVALEYYEINELRVNFNTLDLADNIDAEVDYAANYNSVTPYFSFRYFYPPFSDNYAFSSRFIMAWPLPRVGFHGQVTGPGFSVEGDSESAGKGTHIPDPFAGVGFTIESREHGWRLDVGASLWFILYEDKVHEGIDPPLFIHMNWPIN